VFAELDETPRGKTCDAIVGIIEEGQVVTKEYKGSPALDAGLLAAAQAVEHYEISRYGTLKTWAQELGLEEAVGLLDTTLAEEKKTDEVLTEIAESTVNQHAEAAQKRVYPAVRKSASLLKANSNHRRNVRPLSGFPIQPEVGYGRKSS